MAHPCPSLQSGAHTGSPSAPPKGKCLRSFALVLQLPRTFFAHFHPTAPSPYSELKHHFLREATTVSTPHRLSPFPSLYSSQPSKHYWDALISFLIISFGRYSFSVMLHQSRPLPLLFIVVSQFLGQLPLLRRHSINTVDGILLSSAPYLLKAHDDPSWGVPAALSLSTHWAIQSESSITMKPSHGHQNSKKLVMSNVI